MSSSHRGHRTERPVAPITSIEPLRWAPNVELGRTEPTHEIRLDSLAGHESEAFLVCDFTGRIMFANRRAAAVLGLASARQLVGGSSDQLAQRFEVEEWDGTPITRPAFPAMAAADRVLRFRDPTVGWERWTLVRTQACAEAHGTVLAVLHLLQDVSQERRAQDGVRLLAEAGQRLNRSLSRDRVLEHAAVVAVPRLGDEAIILMKDAGGGFSPTTWQIPGEGAVCRAQTLVQRCASTLERLDAETGPALLRYDKGTAGSSPGESILVLPIDQDGEIGGAMVMAMAGNTGRIHHPLDLALGERLAELVAAALTNAAQLEAEQGQRHALQRRGEVADRDSARSAGLLRMVERELAGELVGPAGNVPREQSSKLFALATSLRELSRIRAGAELDRCVLDLREVLALTQQAARPDLERTGQEVRVEDAGRLLVLGDSRCLVRTFVNLLSTVTAHAVAPGPITIQAAARAGSLVEVTLRGPALAAPMVPLDDVLESFGALSLAVDRHLIELHGGEIWALPPDPQRGTAFKVQLPLVLPRA